MSWLGSYPLVALPIASQLNALLISALNMADPSEKHTFRICCPTHVHHVHKRIRMSQVVQEAIPQALAHVRSRYQPRYVEKLDRYASPSIDARAIVRFAFALHAHSLARAFDLQIPNRALRINGCESLRASVLSRCRLRIRHALSRLE